MSAPAWRLFADSPASGSWNMGVDEALLESARESGRGALRLYRWDGPWLSLGYAQRLGPEQARACASAGVGVVRRATGGRAVLHGADLTYCVVAPERALPGGLRATYALLAEALCLALQRMGLAVERVSRRRGAPDSPGFDCFAAPAADELCVRGRKLVGSAQRRSPGGVLQHGSIRLAPDPAAAAAAAGLLPGVATSLLEEGCEPALPRVEQELAAAFGRVLGVTWEKGELSAEERLAASRRGFSPSIEGLREPGEVAGLPQGGGAATDQ